MPAGTLAALRERLQAEDEQRIGGRSSAGGAELLDPVPLRSTSSGVGPLDQHPRCLVAPLTSAHNYPATTLQRRQTIRPEFPADCVVVASIGRLQSPKSLVKSAIRNQKYFQPFRAAPEGHVPG